MVLEAADVTKRYVLPDMIEKREDVLIRDHSALLSKLRIERDERAARFQYETISELTYVRQPIDVWMARHESCVVLGQPGAGKSSLLRFLALDVLAAEPELTSLHQKWGSYLPIWIPFAFWTRQVQSDAVLSVPAVFKRWLETWDEDADFLALFERALNDNRLLVLVDGLDEASNENAAAVALQQLQVFIEKRHLPCVVTCRTQSFAKLALYLGAWPAGEVAAFDKSQQQEFCQRWYVRFLTDAGEPPGASSLDSKANKLALDFLNEAWQVSALRGFLENPLLLGLLVTQKFLRHSLPANKTEALEALVSHLVLERPRGRETAAGVVATREIGGEDLLGLLSFLAFQLLIQLPEGVADKNIIAKLTEEYLRSEEIGFGWTAEKAHAFSQKLITEASERLGILVEKSPRAVGFYHRSIQEYLAARHLARLPLSAQIETICSYCTKPEWMETFVFFITQVSSGIRELIENIISGLFAKPRSHDAAALLLSNAIFLNPNCPVVITKRLAPTVLEDLYLNPEVDARRNVLASALNGLCKSRAADIIRGQIPFWYPCRSTWRSSLIKALQSWERSEPLARVLWRGLFDEETNNRRAAAATLGVIYKGEPGMFTRLAELFESDLPVQTRAVALEALLTGWSVNVELRVYVERASEDENPELRVLGITGSLRYSPATEEQLEQLIQAARDAGSVDHSWKDLAIDTIAQHWKSDTTLKAHCFKVLRRRDSYAEEAISRDEAWYLLVKNFPGDTDVARVVAEEFERERPFGGFNRDIWKLLGDQFPGNEVIRASYEGWAERDQYNERELSLSVAIAPNNRIKARLLQHLGSWVPFWAAEALLKHWHDDPSVLGALSDFVEKDDRNAANVGYLLPKIWNDRNASRAKLVSLLRDREVARLDFVMRGLFEIDNQSIRDDVIEAFFSVDRKNLEDLINTAGAELLISRRPDSPAVRSLALQQLREGNGLDAVIARAYRSDAEFQEVILRMVSPLATELRFQLVERVACPDISMDLQKEILSKYRFEYKPNVKSTAAIGYHRTVKESEKITVEEAERKLGEEAFAVGPEFEGTRQAAFCGFVELGRAERLKELLDPRQPGKFQLFELPRQSIFERNVVLMELIVDKWSYLKTALGERFVSILSGKDGSLADIWEGLADFAEKSPELRDQIIAFIESSGVGSSYSLLNFFRRNRPRSESLLNSCLALVRQTDRQPQWGGENAVEYLAADVIGTHFNDRPDVLIEIERMLVPPFSNFRAIVALGIGWPRNIRLKEVFDFMSTNRLGTAFPALAHLVCNRGSSKRVLQLFGETMERMSGYGRTVAQWALAPLEKRFQNDPRVVQLGIEWLKSREDWDVRVTLLQFYLRLGIDLASLNSWAQQELVTQTQASPRRGKRLINFQILLDRRGS